MSNRCVVHPQQHLDAVVWERIRRYPLKLDQTDAPIDLDLDTLKEYYYPIACRLIDRAQSDQRFLVAVAGPPGCGKTAFAAILAAVLNAVVDQEAATSIPLDGWHYPNEYLHSHKIQWRGNEVALNQIKGAPETYDTSLVFQCIEKVKAGEEVGFPIYSRTLHDPVPNGGRVKKQNRIVIVEGNYLLLQEEPWQRFRHLFDLSIMMIAQRETLVDGLRQRHLRGKKSEAMTEKQISYVDLPNIDRVLDNSGPADIIVHKADSRKIEKVVYAH